MDETEENVWRCECGREIEPERGMAILSVSDVRGYVDQLAALRAENDRLRGLLDTFRAEAKPRAVK